MPNPFYRFRDNGLRSFAATTNTGDLLPKTDRITAIEDQNGNPIIQYPFGTMSDGTGGVLSKFANDADYGQTGINRLAPLVRKGALLSPEVRAFQYLKTVIAYLEAGQSVSEINSFAVLNGNVNGYTITYNSIDANHYELFLVPDLVDKYRTIALLFERVGYNWHVQWFISDKGDTGLTSLYDLYTPKNLPLPADVNGFTFQSVFWDYDFVQTDIDETGSIAPLIVHPGDQLRFNLIPEESNTVGLQSVYVGLVDVNGDVLEDFIGETTLPPLLCNCVTRYEYTYSSSEFNDLRVNINSNIVSPPQVYYTGFYIFIDGNLTYQAQSLVPNEFLNDAEETLIYLTGLSNSNILIEGVINNDDSVSIFATLLYNDECLSEDNQASIQTGISQEIAPDEINQFEVIVVQSCCEITQLLATVNIPNNLPDGCYQMYLHDGYSGIVYAFSNQIQVDAFETFTTLISYSGNGIAQGFEYYSDWSQQARVPLNGGAEELKLQDSQYRDSNGKYRRPSQKSDLILNLHTGWIDKPTLLAMYAATQHSNLVWNGRSIFVQGEVEVSHPQDFSTESSYFGLSQLKFQANIQGSQPIDKGCINC